MLFKLMIFFLVLAPFSYDHTFAQEMVEKELAGFDPAVDIISDNYEAGPYLIYDCREKHFTCVMESYFLTCADRRRRDLIAKKPRTRCVPIGEFPTKKSCFQRQLYMASNAYGTRFCIGDHWKKKDLE